MPSEFYRMAKEHKVLVSMTMPTFVHAFAIDRQARIATISGIQPSLSAVFVSLMERGMAGCKSEWIGDDPEEVVDLSGLLNVGEEGRRDSGFDESEFE